MAKLSNTVSLSILGIIISIIFWIFPFPVKTKIDSAVTLEMARGLLMEIQNNRYIVNNILFSQKQSVAQIYDPNGIQYARIIPTIGPTKNHYEIYLTNSDVFDSNTKRKIFAFYEALAKFESTKELIKQNALERDFLVMTKLPEEVENANISGSEAQALLRFKYLKQKPNNPDLYELEKQKVIDYLKSKTVRDMFDIKDIIEKTGARIDDINIALLELKQTTNIEVGKFILNFEYH